MNEDDLHPFWAFPMCIIIGCYCWLMMNNNDSTILMAQKLGIAIILGAVTMAPVVIVFARINEKRKFNKYSKNIEREAFKFQQRLNKEEHKVEDIVFLKKKDETSYSLEICEKWVGERNAMIIEKFSYPFRSEVEKKECPCCKEDMGFDRDGRLNSSCACPSIKKLVKA